MGHRILLHALRPGLVPLVAQLVLASLESPGECIARDWDASEAGDPGFARRLSPSGSIPWWRE